MIHRSYLGSQATLIKNSYTNNSRNPIIELSYGGSVDSATTKVSRYVFKIDLDNIISKISDNEINQTNIISHKLKFTNCISLSDEYIGVNYLTSKRATGFDLVLLKLNESFDEGTGFDFIYSDSQYREIDLNKSSANWFNRKNPQVTWSMPGIFSGTTEDITTGVTSTTILNTQRFEIGNEDIELDVTDVVNEILFSSTTNNGFGIVFSANTETISSKTKFVVTFFSKYTQTFFEPYLETEYDNYISDDRCCLTYNTDVDLHFISPFTVNSVDSLEILNSEGLVISSITTSAFTQVSNKIYKVTINIPETDYQQYTDMWTYTLNGVQKTFENTFNMKPIEIYNTDNDIYSTEIFINISGIKQNEVVSKKSGVKRLIFKPKRLVKNRLLNNLIGDIEFRVFVTQGKNQIEVIPFTKASKINNTYYTDIDFSWLIPHDYFIEVRATDKFDTQYPNSNSFRFRVTN